MEREEVKFPRYFIKMVAERHIAGLRFPEKYGGRNAS